MSFEDYMGTGSGQELFSNPLGAMMKDGVINEAEMNNAMGGALDGIEDTIDVLY
jgi:hypothetical protein